MDLDFFLFFFFFYVTPEGSWTNHTPLVYWDDRVPGIGLKLYVQHRVIKTVRIRSTIHRIKFSGDPGVAFCVAFRSIHHFG